MRPRLLDLFCGAGGASMGYHRAGFDVVGVDIEPHPDHPFPMYVADALDVLDDLLEHGDGTIYDGLDFAAIHASPPCQGYTTMNNRHGSAYPKLLDPVRERLQASGLPYVIENVPGALAHMRSPVELTGEMFGLGVHRPRLFESNVLLLAPARPRRQKNAAAVYGKPDGRRLWTRSDGTELHVANLETASTAMGIDWMTWDDLREAIPPAYSEWIGSQLLAALEVAA
jgi:DNA (cytosine-5)-methyltransferase 1